MELRQRDMESTTMMAAAVLVVMILALGLGPLSAENDGQRNNLHMMPELVIMHGYPCETHTVRTQDEYILTVHRIPYGQYKSMPRSKGTNFPTVGKYPVLLQHGLLGSSADWTVLGPQRSLAFILADTEYDVWIGNSRGNVYSMNHTTMNAKNADFWNFSFHEMGTNDLPAVIDYILEKTQQNQIYYVGHSMGSTSFFAMTSMLPHYGNKIRLMTSLSPVSYMNHCKSPMMKFLALSFNSIFKKEFTLSLLSNMQFMPNDKLLQNLDLDLCLDVSMYSDVCYNILFHLAGYDMQEMNATTIESVLHNTPAGGSTKTIQHYTQSISSGHFRLFNYDVVENGARYMQPKSPEYSLDEIMCPIVIFDSLNDWLADIEDVDYLVTKLPNVVRRFHVTRQFFNNLDFVFGDDARKLVYEKLITVMGEFGTRAVHMSSAQSLADQSPIENIPPSELDEQEYDYQEPEPEPLANYYGDSYY